MNYGLENIVLTPPYSLFVSIILFFGTLSIGDLFVKRNGPGATVKGLTFEFRANLEQKLQIESGLTLQKSLYDEAVSYSDELESRKEFLRTPNHYGYATLSYNPSSKLSFSANLVHTGVMDILHLAGAPEQTEDEFIKSPTFNVIGLKATYIQQLSRVGAKLEYSVGVKNLTNDYQQNLDTLKDRDSSFVYGPNLPRTIYFGLVLKSL